MLAGVSREIGRGAQGKAAVDELDPGNVNIGPLADIRQHQRPAPDVFESDVPEGRNVNPRIIGRNCEIDRIPVHLIHGNVVAPEILYHGAFPAVII